MWKGRGREKLSPGAAARGDGAIDEVYMRGQQPVYGFTIIELLVVMAIIAILAALLFPVLASVQLQSRENVCMGNLQQIAIALTAYERDYTAYPFAPCFDGTRFQGGVSALYPTYITDKTRFICPDDTNLGNIPNASAIVYSSYNGIINPSTLTFEKDANGYPERLYNRYGYDSSGYDGFTCPPPPTSQDYCPTCTAPSGTNLNPNYPPNFATGSLTPPPFLAQQGLTDRAFPMLRNPYAPGNTIVTHCPYHRNFYGTNPTQQMDMVLRLDGKTEKDNVAPMGSPDPNSGTPPWIEQK
jgi:prepilin-type N-terminal cleavage/methylation domain-containing protein